MDAIVFFRELDRMCKSHIGRVCLNCPLHDVFINIQACKTQRFTTSTAIVPIVEKWSRENPVKTMMDDFFEKFPNAPKEDSGAPCGCPWEMGYCKQDSGICDYISCDECWSRPLEVTK